MTQVKSRHLGQTVTLSPQRKMTPSVVSARAQKMSCVFVKVTKPCSHDCNYEFCPLGARGGSSVTLLWSHKVHRGRRSEPFNGFPTVRYSKTPVIRKVSLWSNSTFLRKPVIQKTNLHRKSSKPAVINEPFSLHRPTIYPNSYPALR